MCINCDVPNNVKIGYNFMMWPDIPMNMQGYISEEAEETVIEEDVWIGINVTMTPGRTIKKRTVIGACCLPSKDFSEYSVVGGVPSKLIRSRLSCK